jgi:hypothetical protein
MKIISIRNILLFFVIAAVMVLVVVFVITRPFFLKNILLPQLSEEIGMPLYAEKVELSLLDTRLIFKNVKIGYADNSFIVGKEISTCIDILQAVKGSYNLNNVCLKSAGLILKRDKNYNWNIPGNNDEDSGSDSSDSGFTLDFSDINIINSFINIDLYEGKKHTAVKLNNLNMGFSVQRYGIFDRPI